MNYPRLLCYLGALALLAHTNTQAFSQPSPFPAATVPSSSASDSAEYETDESSANAPDNLQDKDYQNEAVEAEFAPTLLWDNGLTALDFPIHWMTVSHQGTVFLGSMFSKTFTGYSIYNGICKGRQSLPTPAAYPPLIVGTNAIISDSSTALLSLDAESMVINWERLPLRPPRSGNDLRKPLPRPRTNKVSPIVFADKIVTMNTDGLVLFYHNAAPDKSGFPDYIDLKTSPDEEGTFRITPIIKRQVLYTSTTTGHIHFANLNNIQDTGVVKNLPQANRSSIAREVRTPLVAGSNSLFLTTMDGTLNCYSLFNKIGYTFNEPKLQWSVLLPSRCLYHTNRWGYPITRPVVDDMRNAVFVCTKDCVHARSCDTGEEIWHHYVPQGISCPPLLWSHYLLIVSEPKGKIPAKITALDPTDGHTIASQTLRDAPSSEPVVWNNYFVVGYYNGFAECYDLAGNAKKADVKTSTNTTTPTEAAPENAPQASPASATETTSEAEQ